MRQVVCSAVLSVAIPVACLAGDDPTTTFTPDKPLLPAPDLGDDFTPANEDAFIPQTTVRKRVSPDDSASLPPYLPDDLTPESTLPGDPAPPAAAHPPLAVTPPLAAPAVPLYPNVRIRNSACAHPQGVPTVIPVPDPRNRCGVVYIEVCLPPCPYEIRTGLLLGRRARLDFGGYSVSIITRRGVVIVDYHS